MNDPKITPAKPVSIPSVQTQGNAISPATPARLLIHDVPVRQAPPALQNPPQPVHIEGRVVSSNPQSQELRIATTSGEVTVQSSVSLPPGTEVRVDIYMQKGVALATVTLLRQQAQMSQNLEQLVPPQTTTTPPLKPGDVVQAIYLPEPHETTALPPPTTPPPLTLEQVAEIINNFPTSSLQKLPVPLPEGAVQAATMPDVLATLKNLPAAQQAQIAAYLARPDVLEALKKILPPEIAKNLQPPDALLAAPPNTAFEEEPLDDNILQIVKVQTGTRMAGTPTGLAAPLETPESASAPPPVLAALKGLLPLIEALQPQESPLSMLAQQLMPARIAPGGLPLAEQLPQSMYEVKVLSITPPDVSAPPVKPGETQGIAESVSPRGFPVIRVENDLFVLKTLAPVPRGSIVTFQALALTPDQVIKTATATAATGADWFHPLLSRDWPALQETLNAIATTAPTLLQNLRDTLPAATPRLAPTALFFLAALRAGDVQSWLGEPVLQALRQTGRLSLVDRLTGDFSKISATTRETVAGDWRALSMPLLHDDQISQIQFFVRRQHDDEQKKDGGEPRPVTRFILNLRLSRMGDMQLDGLLRQKRFDLILRSADQLPFSMRRDLMHAFARGLAQADMAGGVSFQAKAQGWVSIGVPNQGTVA
ncbi:MAG: hypothetical protein EPN97_08750 [Alphaproteobacteria bacterium]|nr:MAG: hypothetical protein EPN97_08750 [Alphaproteobacteria bacterium]